MRISELMPLLAKQADKYSIIRSMTHGNNGHETASYMVQTAHQAGGHDVFPCAGAVVSLFKDITPGIMDDSALCSLDAAAGAVSPRRDFWAHGFNRSPREAILRKRHSRGRGD